MLGMFQFLFSMSIAYYDMYVLACVCTFSVMVRDPDAGWSSADDDIVGSGENTLESPMQLH